MWLIKGLDTRTDVVGRHANVILSVRVRDAKCQHVGRHTAVIFKILRRLLFIELLTNDVNCFVIHFETSVFAPHYYHITE